MAKRKDQLEEALPIGLNMSNAPVKEMASDTTENPTEGPVNFPSKGYDIDAALKSCSEQNTADQFEDLSLEDRMKHSNVKARMHAYNSLKETLLALEGTQTPEEHENVILANRLTQLTSESNLMGQLKAMEALQAFFSTYPKLDFKSGEGQKKINYFITFLASSLKVLVEKFLTSAKTSEITQTVLFSIIEQIGLADHIENKDTKCYMWFIDQVIAFIEAKIKKAGNATKLRGAEVKSATACLVFFRKCLTEFGASHISLKTVTTFALQFAEVTDKALKESFYRLMVEIFTWAQNSQFQDLTLNDVPTPQQKQLKKECESIPKEAPKPLRDFQGLQADTTTVKKTEVKLDQSLFNEVDVIRDVCNKEWETQVLEGVVKNSDSNELPWKIKHLALSKFENELKANPRIKRTPHLSNLVTVLSRIIKHEQAIPVLATAIRICICLSTAFESEFLPYCKQLIPVLMVKFRESNKQVLSATIDCIRSFFPICPCEFLIDEIRKNSKLKVAAVRQVCLDVLNSMLTDRIIQDDCKKSIQQFVNIASSLADDGALNVRNAALNLLSTIADVSGFEEIQSTLATMHPSKQKTVINSIQSLSDGAKASRIASFLKSGDPNTQHLKSGHDIGSVGSGSHIGNSTVRLKKSSSSVFSEKNHASNTIQKSATCEDEVFDVKSDSSTEHIVKKTLPPAIYSTLISERTPNRASVIVNLHSWWAENPEKANPVIHAILLFLRMVSNEFSDRNQITNPALFTLLHSLPSLTNHSVDKETASILLHPFTAKLVDSKYKEDMIELAFILAEYVGPAFVSMVIIKVNEDSRNMKVFLESCKLLEQLVKDFGLGPYSSIRFLLSFAKRHLESKLKPTRLAACSLVATLQRYSAGKIISLSLDGVSDDSKKIIRDFYDKATYFQPFRVVRGGKSEKDGDATSISVAAEANSGPEVFCSGPPFPNSIISNELFRQCRDTDFKNRIAALEKVKHLLSSSELSRTTECLSEVIYILTQRLSDQNRLVAKEAISILHYLPDIFLPYLYTYSKLVIPRVLDCVSDKVTKVAEAAEIATMKWAKTIPIEHWFHSVMASIGDCGHAEQRELILRIISSPDMAFESDAINAPYFPQLTHFLADCFSEKYKKLRTLTISAVFALHNVFGNALQKIFYECKSLHKEALISYLPKQEKNGGGSGWVSANSSSSQITSQAHTATLKHSEAALPTFVSTDMQTSLNFSEFGPNPIIETFLSRTVRDDNFYIHRWSLEITTDMRETLYMDLKPLISSHLMAAMFERQKIVVVIKSIQFWISYLSSIQSFEKYLLGPTGFLDLLFKWITIKLIDSNLRVLLCTTDLILLILNTLVILKYRLSESELNIFGPHLAERVGAGNPQLRKRLREALGLLSKIVEHRQWIPMLMRGLNSCYKRSVADCLDELFTLVEASKSVVHFCLNKDIDKIASILCDSKVDKDVKFSAIRLFGGLTCVLGPELFEYLKDHDLTDEMYRSVADVSQKLEAVWNINESVDNEGNSYSKKNTTSVEEGNGEQYITVATSNKLDEMPTIEEYTADDENIPEWIIELKRGNEAIVKSIPSEIQNILDSIESGTAFACIDDSRINMEKFSVFIENSENIIKEKVHICECYTQARESDELMYHHHEVEIGQYIQSFLDFRSVKSNHFFWLLNAHIHFWIGNLFSKDIDTIANACKCLHGLMKMCQNNSQIANAVDMAILSSSYPLCLGFIKALDYLYRIEHFSEKIESSHILMAIICTLQAVELFLKKKKPFFCLPRSCQKNLCKQLLSSMARYQNHVYKNETINKSEENSTMNGIVINMLNQCAGKDILQLNSDVLLSVMDFIFQLVLDAIQGQFPDIKTSKNEDLIWKLLGKVYKRIHYKLKDDSPSVLKFGIKLLNRVLAAWQNLMYLCASLSTEFESYKNRIFRYKFFIKLFLNAMMQWNNKLFCAYLYEFGWFEELKLQELTLLLTSDETSPYCDLPKDTKVDWVSFDIETAMQLGQECQSSYHDGFEKFKVVQSIEETSTFKEIYQKTNEMRANLSQSLSFKNKSQTEKNDFSASNSLIIPFSEINSDDPTHLLVYSARFQQLRNSFIHICRKNEEFDYLFDALSTSVVDCNIESLCKKYNVQTTTTSSHGISSPVQSAESHKGPPVNTSKANNTTGLPRCTSLKYVEKSVPESKSTNAATTLNSSSLNPTFHRKPFRKPSLDVSSEIPRRFSLNQTKIDVSKENIKPAMSQIGSSQNRNVALQLDRQGNRWQAHSHETKQKLASNITEKTKDEASKISMAPLGHDQKKHLRIPCWNYKSSDALQRGTEQSGMLTTRGENMTTNENDVASFPNVTDGKERVKSALNTSHSDKDSNPYLSTLHTAPLTVRYRSTDEVSAGIYSKIPSTSIPSCREKSKSISCLHNH